MNNFTVSDFARAISRKMEKPMEVAQSIAQSIAGVMPVTHNTLDEAKKDVLTIVADVHQRVMNIEEEIKFTSHTDDDISEQLVQGYLAILAGRKIKKKVPEQIIPLPKVEEMIARLAAGAPVEPTQLEIPLTTTPKEVPGDGRPRIRFDDPAAE